MTEKAWQTIGWQIADGVGTLTLQRPPLNILNIAMLRELGEALALAAGEASLRVLVLRAQGTLRVFSAGADVGDHKAGRVGEMIPLMDGACAALAGFPAPTLAVVHGHALGGGCELALCCDLIYAAQKATFGQPEIKLATFAPVASMQLPGLVGYRRAAELLLTGEAIPAAEAERIGLINRAVPDDELGGAVDALLDRLKALSGAALRAAKRGLQLGVAGWPARSAVEVVYLQDLMSTADVHEGLNAFEEKRAPVWQHR
ncbi:MAG: enoyl-CoA hydratase/isomerase family protein [Chloroflexi bacterium]|nr:enoyl-CoA hydratase/isomerase family protein [Chloroflexota bacterium]